MAEQAAGTAKAAATFGSRSQITVKVASNITLDNVQSIVRRVGGLTGCTTCGLLGVDLTLSGDPEEFAEIGSLPGVQSVGFSG